MAQPRPGCHHRIVIRCDFVLQAWEIRPTGKAMKFHEWHYRDEEAGERRYFRAGKFGKKWHVKTTLKSDPDWEDLEPVPLPVLVELRDLLANKYQRRRIPYEDVVALDKMVVDSGGPSVLADLEK